ncbi:hypothetical protein BZY95_13270 [Billgrantia desiderata SP1]|uniref:DUF5343 domain-containing protein n=1 Tax=Billgrantia desiderata TaxID=52021 RepID=UPI000A3BD399|nr:DUF5343 domain-containing protein [Halomonas desiderata]OUE40928.1 hypothetical protein BZY95_13270 [Halomonas desiderata SP1]
MAENLPYSTSAGTLEKMLDKIKTASEPDRFTQDFVSTKLSMKGGTAKACIPFLKKMGLVGSDGSPTDLYREYRNPKKSRLALGKAFRIVYDRLYEMNEYVHDADDAEVLGLIVECTGGEKTSAATKYTLGTFNMLRKHADFDGVEPEDEGDDAGQKPHTVEVPPPSHQLPVSLPQTQGKKGINLSYTINLNLPPTKDIEVFNAIFKSLKQHILDQ